MLRSACSGRSSRSSCQVVTGLHSASPSLAGEWKSHNSRFLLCCSVRVPCLYHTVCQALQLSTWWQPRYNSSRTLSSPSSVTATDGASVCVRVWAMSPVDVGNRNEHIISKEVQVVGCCARGAGRYKLSPPRDFKNNRAATVHAARTGAVQQQYNSTSSSKSGPCDSRCAFVFLWVCSAHQKIRYMQS